MDGKNNNHNYNYNYNYNYNTTLNDTIRRNTLLIPVWAIKIRNVITIEIQAIEKWLILENYKFIMVRPNSNGCHPYMFHVECRTLTFLAFVNIDIIPVRVNCVFSSRYLLSCDLFGLNETEPAAVTWGFLCLFGFLTSSSTTRLHDGGSQDCRLTILVAATHQTELRDHDFCLSRSHDTDTDPTGWEPAATAGI